MRFRTHPNHGTALVLFLVASPPLLQADPVRESQVHLAVENWLKQPSQLMAETSGMEIERVEAVPNAQGQTLFYVTHLLPEGFIISSADSELEPILSFSPNGRFEANVENPLFAIIQKDLTQRQQSIAKANSAMTRNLGQARGQAKAKWERLLNHSNGFATRGIDQVDDPRVDPLTKTRWGQSRVSGINVFNHFTPENISCGCAATAMAQLIRYHEWPKEGIGAINCSIKVHDKPETATTRGGDGQGGPYNWALMPYEPTAEISQAEIEMIGSLTYDVGLSLNMAYSEKGGHASVMFIVARLMENFKYSNAILGYKDNQDISSDPSFLNRVNPNLDAGLPVIFGISAVTPTRTVGHAVVCDGYGYNQGTLYHHVSLGWNGGEDAWYQLPTIDAGYDFNVIGRLVYNVYTEGKGECVSGRALDEKGLPLSSVTLTLGEQSATTNERGIFSFKCIPSGNYTLSAAKEGLEFKPQEIVVGRSASPSKNGNIWGLEFKGAVPIIPAVDPIQNGGFEDSTNGWSGNTERIGNQKPAFEGQNAAWLCGRGRRTAHQLSQTFSLPADATRADLTFQLQISTTEKSNQPYDKLWVNVLSESGALLQSLATFSNTNASTSFQSQTFDLSAYKGQNITLQFKGTEDGLYPTSFVLDAVQLQLN